MGELVMFPEISVRHCEEARDNISSGKVIHFRDAASNKIPFILSISRSRENGHGATIEVDQLLLALKIVSKFLIMDTGHVTQKILEQISNEAETFSGGRDGQKAQDIINGLLTDTLTGLKGLANTEELKGFSHDIRVIINEIGEIIKAKTKEPAKDPISDSIEGFTRRQADFSAAVLDRCVAECQKFLRTLNL